ncbi:MAG: SDR family NAD(P)-dependent oxidoreductase [Candidatus Woesearchaeota archaeon]
MFDLKGKVAIITGAAGGLGKSMALALSKQGADIAIFDLKDGKNVSNEIETKSKFYKVDVSSEKSIKKNVNKVKKDFGSVDILINNAGIHFSKPLIEMERKDWDKLMSINVTGYYLMAKYVYPLMNDNSRIINVSSVAGHHAFAQSSAYNSSKGAVIQLTKSMAMEFSEKANVNAICPGIFVTPMTDDLVETDLMKDKINSSVLLNRAGKSDEIGGLVVYLASDESSYMTGSIITIDGGWTSHL